MYIFPDEPKTKIFFKCDKNIVFGGKWAALTGATKSVYVPIAVHTNRQGSCFPSERTLAIQTGRTRKTIRLGIKKGWPLFSFKRYKTRNGNRGKSYKLNLCPEDRRYFPIYKWVVEGGYWSKLTPGAHALYPVMMALSYLDSDLYSGLEDLDYGCNTQKMIDEGEFKIRKYDFFDKGLIKMASYAGISRNTAKTARDQLEQLGLIEWIEDFNVWKIFRQPMLKLRLDLLNKEIALKYQGK